MLMRLCIAPDSPQRLRLRLACLDCDVDLHEESVGYEISWTSALCDNRLIDSRIARKSSKGEDDAPRFHEIDAISTPRSIH
jgi:hypothetical protein